MIHYTFQLSIEQQMVPRKPAENPQICSDPLLNPLENLKTQNN